MEIITPRPTIDQLEELLHKTSEGEIEILSNGDIGRLTTVELLEKKYKLEQGRNELLLKELNRLRGVIRQNGRQLLKEIQE